jgi:hypothetical protein
MAGPVSKPAVWGHSSECVNLLYILGAPQTKMVHLSCTMWTEQGHSDNAGSTAVRELYDFSFWCLAALHTKADPLRHTLQSPSSGCMGWKEDGLTIGVCVGVEQLQCMPWLNSESESHRLDTDWKNLTLSYRVIMRYYMYHTIIKHANILLPIFKFGRNNVLPHVTHDRRISPGKPRRNHNHLYITRWTDMTAFSGSRSVKLEVSPIKEPMPKRKKRTGK